MAAFVTCKFFLPVERPIRFQFHYPRVGLLRKLADLPAVTEILVPGQDIRPVRCLADAGTNIRVRPSQHLLPLFPAPESSFTT